MTTPTIMAQSISRAAATLVMFDLGEFAMVVAGTKQSGNKPRKKSKQFPILILGWRVEGAGDVEFISRAFPNDHGLDCVKAPYADSRKVMKEISSWLKGNSNAQFCTWVRTAQITALCRRMEGKKKTKLATESLEKHCWVLKRS